MPENIFENFRFDGRKVPSLFYHTWQENGVNFYIFTLEVHANLDKCQRARLSLWLTVVAIEDSFCFCKSYILHL